MLELTINDPERLSTVTHALSSQARLKIIKLLNEENMNIHQIAGKLSIPVSTTAAHIRILEEAGLIHTELRPASRGAMKMCSRNFDDLHIILNNPPTPDKSQAKQYEVEIPIGQYTDFEVAPTCGMADRDSLLIPEDAPVHFYNPNRMKAQVIWTRKGFLEYKFPIVIDPKTDIKAIEFSLEICSEAPNYDHNWPSDITVWINNVEIGTWTSPGDFGERPGKLNSEFWSETTNTQYGLLKVWKVSDRNTMIDDFKLSDITLKDLGISNNDNITFKIGIKEDAQHKGGMNIFGKECGDYQQDIKMKAIFE